MLRLSGTTWSEVGSGYARPEAVTASGSSLYVADTGNSRVLQLDANTGALQRTVASAGTGTGQVREPEGVAADARGNVLVSDTGNDRVLRFDAGGAYIDSLGGNGTAAGQLIQPAQVTVAGGDALVADPFNNRVQRFTLSTWTLATAARIGVARGGTGTGSLRIDPTGR